MKLFIRILVSVVAIFSFGSSSFGAKIVEFKLSEPIVETLPSGLKIAWFYSDRLPMIEFTFLVKSGFRNDPIGKSGTTELLLSSLDQMPASKAIDHLGATRLINADEDTLTLNLRGLSQDADLLVEALGGLVIHPDFSKVELIQQKSLLVDRRFHLGDYSDILLGLAYRRFVTSESSYGRGNLLSTKELREISAQDLSNYHELHFIPRDSVLMIYGRIDKESFRRKVLSIFGDWKANSSTPTPARIPAPIVRNHFLAKDAGSPIVIISRENSTQSQIRMGFPAPLIQAPEHYPLTVANSILGQLVDSRFNSVIRDKLGLTYGISSSFSFNREFAEFSVTSSTRSETTGRLLKKILDVLKGFSSDPISAREISAAKDQLIGEFLINHSTIDGVVSRWITGEVFELGPSYLNEFISRINQVSADDIRSAIRKYFKVNRFWTVVIGEPKSVKKSLEEAGFKSIKQISVRDLE